MNLQQDPVCSADHRSDLPSCDLSQIDIHFHTGCISPHVLLDLHNTEALEPINIKVRVRMVLFQPKTRVLVQTRNVSSCSELLQNSAVSAQTWLVMASSALPSPSCSLARMRCLYTATSAGKAHSGTGSRS
jgi:hypothetical protein